MERVEQRVSPQAFARIQEELLRASLSGLDPDACVRWACARVGLWPKAGTETVLIVDYSLKSVCNPFEELCSEDVAG
jgi:hypothetical protein